MNEKHLAALQNRWMSEKEAIVYLTVLELGSAPASTIARRSWLKRVTTYSVLKELEHKKVIFSVDRNWVIYSQAVDPKKLLSNVQSKYEEFKDVVPELLAYADTYNNKLKVQYYEWLKWVMELYDHILDDAKDEIVAFIWTEWIDPRLEKHLYEQNIPKRVKMWIKARVLVSETPWNVKYAKTDKNSLKKTKVLKKNILQTASEINLYWGDKVAQIMYHKDDLFWIVITSKSLHDNLKSIFDFIWENL